MSVRFADSIDAPSNSTYNAKNPQQTVKMIGQSHFNSMCSKMESQALMDTQQHHQGRLGTPDANETASYMSSDFNNNQQEQQTSHTASIGASPHDLFAQLNEFLALEPKYQPNLFLPLQSNVRYLSSRLS